jgi:HSP20 family molecular chaperone IbpA|tara:strand:+ start:779 stop:1219 length:441 start_codon:yes stop_codon:yes gene_type:complete
MSTLNLFERTPFDLLVRNFLTQEGNYRPVEQNLKLSHPLDIYQTIEGLTFEIACTGIDKHDLEILVEGQTLRVNYNKKVNSEDEELQEELRLEYLYRGIAKRSFNLGWKVDPKFELSKAIPSFKNGLLTIMVPLKEGKGIKTLTIK